MVATSFEEHLLLLKRLETELDQQIKTEGNEDPKVTRFRRELQNSFRTCIIQFPCESHIENIDAQLWRYTFHTPIDYYRRHLKGGKNVESRWASIELHSIIDKGIIFMLTLVCEICRHHGDETLMRILKGLFELFSFPLSLTNQLKDNNVPAKTSLEPLIYRLIIFLGDLCRYRSQFHRSIVDEQRSLSWNVYEVARKLEPDNGHASNQLAVIASLKGDHLLSIFWYVRGLCCGFPFVAAKSNLISFLEKILKEESCHGLFYKCIYNLLSPASSDINCNENITTVTGVSSDEGLMELSMMIMTAGGLYLVTDNSRFANLLDNLILSNSNDDLKDPNALLLLSLLACLNFLESSLDQAIQIIKANGALVTLEEVIKIIPELRGFSLFDGLLSMLSKIDDSSDGTNLIDFLINGGFQFPSVLATPGDATLLDQVDSNSPLQNIFPPTQKLDWISKLDDEDDHEVVVFRGLGVSVHDPDVSE